MGTSHLDLYAGRLSYLIAVNLEFRTARAPSFNFMPFPVGLYDLLAMSFVKAEGPAIRHNNICQIGGRTCENVTYAENPSSSKLVLCRQG